jgi:hypothetical protein
MLRWVHARRVSLAGTVGLRSLSMMFFPVRMARLRRHGRKRDATAQHGLMTGTREALCAVFVTCVRLGTVPSCTRVSFGATALDPSCQHPGCGSLRRTVLYSIIAAHEQHEDHEPENVLHTGHVLTFSLNTLRLDFRTYRAG